MLKRSFILHYSSLIIHHSSMITSATSDNITTITLNRPDKLNAFHGTMREDLLAALRAAENDAACRVVVITGAGRAFCAGGDVEYMAALQREKNVDAFRKLLDAGRYVLIQIANMEKPVIAAINGGAAGAALQREKNVDAFRKLLDAGRN